MIREWSISKSLFEGNALIHRLIRIGVLDKTKNRFDYVLSLRLRISLSVVFKLNF